jgi:glutamine amidotransferase
MRQVTIIDYNLNNVRSLSRAVEVCGAKPYVVSQPHELDRPTHLIIPGVGNFSRAMALLEARGWPPVLRELAAGRATQILGICLGMQLLAERGTEGGDVPGIGLIDGRVERLRTLTSTERIPHVGWNEVVTVRSSPLLAEIPDQTDFYFVHSYQFLPCDLESLVGTTAYGGGFAAIVQRENVFGVQFHPEKSSHMGLRLLQNFISSDCSK